MVNRGGKRPDPDAPDPDAPDPDAPDPDAPDPDAPDPNARMFVFDKHVRLLDTGLSLDAQTRQPLGFISHAHADHMAPHEMILCSPETAELCRFRMGDKSHFREMAYRQSYPWEKSTFTLFPSGHMLGASMLLVEHRGRRLLYTGDCQLKASATADPIELPKADVLVMECTFGDPRFRFQSKEASRDQLLRTLNRIWDEGRLPVVFAYAVGKAQELICVLNQAGIRVAAADRIRAFCGVYEKLGRPLGPISSMSELIDSDPRGTVVVQPPVKHGGKSLIEGFQTRTVAVSGWALETAYNYRAGVDYSVPISDHAGFDDLLQLANQVEPEQVFCLHGSRGFVQHLKRAGHRQVSFLEA